MKGSRAIAFSLDGKMLAGGGSVWNTETWKKIWSYQPTNVLAVAFSPDGKFVASSSPSTTLFEAATGQELGKIWNHPMPHGSNGLLSLSFGRNEGTLATAGLDGIVRVGDPHAGKVHKEIPLATLGSELRAVFSPDGRHLVTANGNGTLYVLRLAPPP
jgi:WD40 repeat protein